MIFEPWVGRIGEILSRIDFMNAIAALIIALTGVFLARRLRDTINSLTHIDAQKRLLFNKIGYYGVLSASLLAALAQLGVNLKVLIGAAGILTVAVGFAAQTSASNLVSGLFLILERPFVVGDVIAIGDTKGVIMSIDLFSTKIRTFTHLMVRIPNETLMKSNIINYSYFPLRRLDINLGVSYDSDLSLVERVLRTIASQNPSALADPEPVFLIQNFADSAVTIQFQVWTLTENMVKVQNEFYREIKDEFDRSGIRIPFPIREIVTHAQALAPGSPS